MDTSQASERAMARLLEQECLRLSFLPIGYQDQTGSCHLLGHEVCIQGPAPSAQRTPQALLRLARKQGVFEATLKQGGSTIAQYFNKARRKQPHLRLFIRLDASQTSYSVPGAAALLKDIPRDSLVIHLTAGREVCGVLKLLEQVAQECRQLGRGVALAMDELGMTYDEALLLWQHQQPEFIVLSPFTTQHLAGEDEDQHTASAFVRRSCSLAQSMGSMVMAEGMDSAALLTAARRQGITLFQGAGVGVASPRPQKTIALAAAMSTAETANEAIAGIQDTIASILEEAPCIAPSQRMSEAEEIFLANTELRSLPVVDSETKKPVGIMRRNQFLETMGGKYGRDLHSKKKVRHFLDADHNIFELTSTLEEVGQKLIESKELEADFIMTDQGRYKGIGRAHGLLEKIINLRINKVRYMNPLTGLPGNVPIQETLRQLLEAKQPFAVCYFDLDNFKAFNDVYGYTSGDRAILLLARLLREYAGPRTDFIGHIGGDDFIAFYRTPDWEQRVRSTMEQFVTEARDLYSDEDKARGYIEATDRQGRAAIFALLSVSVAVVLPDPKATWTTDDIARLAAEAKHDAKRIQGASLAIHPRTTPYPERRQDRTSTQQDSESTITPSGTEEAGTSAEAASA